MKRLCNLRIKNVKMGSLQLGYTWFTARQLSYLVTDIELLSISALDTKLYM